MKWQGEARGWSVGRVGRSEVPFCFSAGVWRRDSSGTLSERDVITTPLLLPSQGVPRTPFHPLSPPPCCTPHEPRVQRGSRQGLPDCLPYLLVSLSHSHTHTRTHSLSLSLAFSLSPSFDFSRRVVPSPVSRRLRELRHHLEYEARDREGRRKAVVSRARDKIV